jgi:hypothetical protein
VLCSQIGQLPIGEAWCCSWCCQAKRREWHKLSPQQQGATAAASLARAAAPQSQPSPEPRNYEAVREPQGRWISGACH